MDKLLAPSNPSSFSDATPMGLDQQRRRERLEEIIHHGLPPFPNTVLELTAILGNPSVDLKRAGKAIRADPSLSAQVLRSMQFANVRVAHPCDQHRASDDPNRY